MNQELKELLSGIELETKCEHCDGLGGERIGGGWVRCDECAGAGLVPTEFGIQILDFVRRNLTAGDLAGRRY